MKFVINIPLNICDCCLTLPEGENALTIADYILKHIIYMNNKTVHLSLMTHFYRQELQFLMYFGLNITNPVFKFG